MTNRETTLVSSMLLSSFNHYHISIIGSNLELVRCFNSGRKYILRISHHDKETFPYIAAVTPRLSWFLGVLSLRNFDYLFVGFDRNSDGTFSREGLK